MYIYKERERENKRFAKHASEDLFDASVQNSDDRTVNLAPCNYI